jgi:hypothetical protein
MVALKATAKVNQSRTLAVVVPECGMEAGEYEAVVMLENAAVAAAAPLWFSSHRLGCTGAGAASRSEMYGDDGR